eukprot:scaffold38269_cov33-Tisochrysis_lutea.AAC.3
MKWMIARNRGAVLRTSSSIVGFAGSCPPESSPQIDSPPLPSLSPLPRPLLCGGGRSLARWFARRPSEILVVVKLFTVLTALCRRHRDSCKQPRGESDEEEEETRYAEVGT